MKDLAEKLCSELHHNSAEIRSTQAAVLERRTKVKACAAERRSMLEASKKLMIFLQNVLEVYMFVTNGVCCICSVFSLITKQAT